MLHSKALFILCYLYVLNDALEVVGVVRVAERGRRRGRRRGARGAHCGVAGGRQGRGSAQVQHLGCTGHASRAHRSSDEVERATRKPT